MISSTRKVRQVGKIYTPDGEKAASRGGWGWYQLMGVGIPVRYRDFPSGKKSSLSLAKGLFSTLGADGISS
jgi:hypothetical protein